MLVSNIVQLVFGMRWQHNELWSGTVNLSSLVTVTKDEKSNDGVSERLPSLLVKFQSTEMVCVCTLVVIIVRLTITVTL